MMRRLTVCIALAVAISGCGGAAQHVPVAAPSPPDAAAPLKAPPMPSSLNVAPVLPAFARPTFPAALARAKAPELSQRNVQALRAAQAAKAPAGRSAGFFANEIYIGLDATGFASYYLPQFGYYTYASATPGARPFAGWFYKYGFGWLYDLGGSSPSATDAYFYDLNLGFFYTAVGFGSDAANFLYFYHFATGHFMVYFQSFNLPRFFYDYNGGNFFSAAITGDMLAFAPNRGWNYQSPINGGITLSTYNDPSLLSDGSMVFAGSAAQGYFPTVLVDFATAERLAVGGLSMREYFDGYHVLGEVSAGSQAVIPGSPLLVGSTLIQGAVSTPYLGVTQTVLNVGPQPGESACGTTRDGAKIRYDVAGNGSWTLAVVPDCGITQFVGANGSTFTLQSVGTYNIGNLAKARRVQSANVATTILSILGRGKQEFPAATIFK